MQSNVERPPEHQPKWLANWRPQDSFGLTVSDDVILKELSLTRKSLQHSGDKAAAIVIEKSLAQFGVPDNWGVLIDDYLDELSQVPPDLLQEIWTHTRRNCKFMPKIADLLEPVKERISARNFKLMRLETLARSRGLNF